MDHKIKLIIMEKQINFNSPVELNKQDRVLEIIPSIKIIEAYNRIFNFDVSPYFENIDLIYLYINDKTGYKYFYPYTIFADSKFYKDLQKYEWYYNPIKWEFLKAKEYIEKGKLLEIGCGRGYFLSILKGNSLLSTKGIEHNEDAIIYCQNKGLDVNKNELSDFPDGNFDYVTSFQVLEHIHDVKYFFENSYRMLKSGGKLIIGVPNNDSFVFYPFSDSYFNNGSLLLNLPPHHMGWWNKKSIKKVGELYGFTLDKIKIEPISKSRINIIENNINNNFNNKTIPRILIKYFNKLFFHFFKGETMLIIFTKK